MGIEMVGIKIKINLTYCSAISIANAATTSQFGESGFLLSLVKRWQPNINLGIIYYHWNIIKD